MIVSLSRPIENYYIPYFEKDLGGPASLNKRMKKQSSDLLIQNYKNQKREIQSKINAYSSIDKRAIKELEQRLSFTKHDIKNQINKKSIEIRKQAFEYSKLFITQSSQKAVKNAVARRGTNEEREHTEVYTINGKKVTVSMKRNMIGTTGGIHKKINIEHKQINIIFEETKIKINNILKEWERLNKEKTIKELKGEEKKIYAEFIKLIKSLERDIKKYRESAEKGRQNNVFSETESFDIMNFLATDINENETLGQYYTECIKILQSIPYISDLAGLNGVYGEAVTALILDSSDQIAKNTIETIFYRVQGQEKTKMIGSKRSEQDKIDVKGIIALPDDKDGEKIDESIRASVKAYSDFSAIHLQNSVDLQSILVALEKQKTYFSLITMTMLGNKESTLFNQTIDFINIYYKYIGASRGNPLKIGDEKELSANVFINIKSDVRKGEIRIAPMNELIKGNNKNYQLGLTDPMTTNVAEKNHWIGSTKIQSEIQALERSKQYINELFKMKTAVIFSNR